MASGAGTQEYTGLHVHVITTHSVTVDLTGGTWGPNERVVRRIYVDSAGSGTLAVRTPFSKSTVTTTLRIATGETLDLNVEKILPASNFTRIKVYW